VILKHSQNSVIDSVRMKIVGAGHLVVISHSQSGYLSYAYGLLHPPGRSVVQVCLLMGDDIFCLDVRVQLLVCTVLSLILSQGVSCRAMS